GNQQITAIAADDIAREIEQLEFVQLIKPIGKFLQTIAACLERFKMRQMRDHIRQGFKLKVSEIQLACFVLPSRGDAVLRFADVVRQAAVWMLEIHCPAIEPGVEFRGVERGFGAEFFIESLVKKRQRVLGGDASHIAWHGVLLFRLRGGKAFEGRPSTPASTARVARSRFANRGAHLRGRCAAHMIAGIERAFNRQYREYIITHQI
ncbi:MAG: hypothetical protein RIR70_268, partial [Pseudomonadota bacterium]